MTRNSLRALRDRAVSPVMRASWVSLLLAGCTLYENGGSSGDGDDTPGGNTGGAGPIGASFLIGRAVVGGVPCSFLDEARTVDVQIDSATSVLVDGAPAKRISVTSGPAIEGDGDPPNVQFAVDEVWESPMGTGFPTIN